MNEIINRSDQTRKRQALRTEATPAERLVWGGLRREACGARFRRQVSVGPFVVDFYCPALRLAVEIDGITHENDEAVAYDGRRQAEIEALGVRFLRFTNEQVYKHLPEVLEMVRAEVARLQVEKMVADDD